MIFNLAQVHIPMNYQQTEAQKLLLIVIHSLA